MKSAGPNDIAIAGSAAIQDGKVEGSRFSFTWTRTVASTGGVPQRSSYPHLTFTGSVNGDQMNLSMDGDYKMDMKGQHLKRWGPACAKAPAGNLRLHS